MNSGAANGRAQSVDEFLLFIKWEFVFLFFVLVFMTSLDFDAQKLKNQRFPSTSLPFLPISFPAFLLYPTFFGPFSLDYDTQKSSSPGIDFFPNHELSYILNCDILCFPQILFRSFLFCFYNDFSIGLFCASLRHDPNTPAIHVFESISYGSVNAYIDQSMDSFHIFSDRIYIHYILFCSLSCISSLLHLDRYIDSFPHRIHIRSF